MRTDILRHEFVEFIPSKPETGVLYVSIEYATAIHLCPCGCGEKVVTPLTPTDWSMKFDGETVSLSPSVGNHSYGCRSHYWVEHDRVRWARSMTDYEIEAVRRRDRAAKNEYYRATPTSDAPIATPADVPAITRRRIRSWFGRRTRK